MKLVWHIVQKDFRRLWAPLGLWALLLVVKGELGGRVLASTGTDWDQLYYLGLMSTTLTVLGMIVNTLLVAALVQEDALVGTRVFWTTRPIGGGRLLAAKVLGSVLMFIVLPLLVAVRWWGLCGYGLAEMGHAALLLAGTQATVVLWALALAALTKNMNEFLGWALGLCVVGTAASFAKAVIDQARQAPTERGITETHSVLLTALALVGVAVVLLVQFKTRRRDRAVLVTIVVAGLAALVSVGDWNFSKLWTPVVPASTLASGVTVSAKNTTTGPLAGVEFTVRGLPDDVGAVAAADHTWQWADGTRATSVSYFSNGLGPGMAEWRALGLPAGAESARTYAAALADGATGTDGRRMPMTFFLWPEQVERLRQEAPRYAGVLHVALLRPTLEFEMPLRTGEAGGRAGFNLRIEREEWVEGEWHLTVAESRPVWSSPLQQGAKLPRSAMTETGMETGFALVNRARGEAVRLFTMPVKRSGVGELVIGSQEVIWKTILRCEVPRDAAEKASGERPKWLEGATLAALRYPEVARFDREVTVERFEAAPEGAVTK